MDILSVYVNTKEWCNVFKQLFIMARINVFDIIFLERLKSY